MKFIDVELTREQAENYCLDKLKNKITKEEVEEILFIGQRVENTFIKAEAYKYLGDLCFNDSNLEEAVFYYIDALELYNNLQYKEKLGYIYNRLGACKSDKFEYLEALSYFNKAYFYSALFKDEITLKKSLYNIGRTYKKLNKFDEAIIQLEEYLKLCDMEKEFINYCYAKMLIANCYEDKEQKDKFLMIYKELVALCKDNNTTLLGYIYNNLASACLACGDLNEASVYYNLAERIRKQYDEKNLPFTYISKSRVFIRQGNYMDALDLVYKGMRLFKENYDEENIIQAYMVLVEIYTLIDDKKNLKKIYSALADEYRNKDMKIDLVKIYSKLAEIALEEDDIQACKKYVNYIGNV